MLAKVLRWIELCKVGIIIIIGLCRYRGVGSYPQLGGGQVPGGGGKSVDRPISVCTESITHQRETCALY